MNEEEKPITAIDKELSKVDKIFHQRICDMFGKHEIMWNGRLEHLNVAEHEIDTKNGTRPFKSTSHRSGPTAGKSNAFGLRRQLEARVIEPAQSEWTVTVLFVNRTDNQLRSRVDNCKTN